MSYPSSAVGCGCDSGESVASQGVTATAGCSGLEVPCIAVTNGVVTGLSSRTLEIPAQEVCPSDLCQEGATEGQVITWNGATWVPDDIPASSVERELSFGLYDLVGASIAINSANNGLPAPDSTDYGVLLMDFKPTNYRLSVFAINLPGSPGTIGYSFEYSTDGTTWTPSGVTFDLNGAVSQIVTITGTLSIPGSPTLVYIRPTYINTSGFDATFSGRSMYWTFWN